MRAAERKTRQQSAIERVFEREQRPLTAVEVFERARVEVPGLGIATVYRVLRTMVDEHRVVPVEIPGASPRYEAAHLGHHHHFHCQACNQVFEVAGCPGDLGQFAPPGFVLDSHEVVLYGRCRGCAAPAGEAP